MTAPFLFVPVCLNVRRSRSRAPTVGNALYTTITVCLVVVCGKYQKSLFAFLLRYIRGLLNRLRGGSACLWHCISEALDAPRVGHGLELSTGTYRLRFFRSTDTPILIHGFDMFLHGCDNVVSSLGKV